jgi:Uma2 family endonuclease
MRGPKNYDFNVDPPPDLAIEVEAPHSADDAVEAWGKLGVPEVWRFDAQRWICTFWNRRKDGSYKQFARSSFLLDLKPDDVVNQMRRAHEIGMTRWRAQLDDWVRQEFLPRRRQGGRGRGKKG